MNVCTTLFAKKTDQEGIVIKIDHVTIAMISAQARYRHAKQFLYAQAQAVFPYCQCALNCQAPVLSNAARFHPQHFWQEQRYAVRQRV
jgi:hypothetical protein